MSVDRFTPIRPSRRRRQHGNARQRTGLVLLVAGVVLFVVSNLGARGGFIVVPFDPHHVIGQLAGPALALLGASSLGRRQG